MSISKYFTHHSSRHNSIRYEQINKNAEKLFKYTKKEFVEIRNYLSNNEYKKFDKSKVNIILEKFNNYIFPKIHWIFDDEKSIEITALKHLYDLGDLKK